MDAFDFHTVMKNSIVSLFNLKMCSIIPMKEHHLQNSALTENVLTASDVRRLDHKRLQVGDT